MRDLADDRQVGLEKAGGVDKTAERLQTAISAVPLRFRLARLWAASAISTVGARTLGVAYPLLALAQTGSPAAAGWAGFALTLPVLVLYVPGGFLVDRISPRHVILCAEAGRMLSVASVLAVMPFGGPSLAHILLAAVAEGVLWVLYTLAEAALLPVVVQPAMMHQAVARSEGAAHIASIAGRPLGGYLFGIGRYVPFAVNAVLFALSCALFLGTGRAAGRRPARPSSLRDLTEGFRELTRHPFLGGSVAVTTFTNLMVNTLIMIFVAGSAGMSSLKIGIVLAAGGVGGVLGSFLAAILPPVRRVLRVHLWIWSGALGLAAVGTMVGLPSYFFAVALVATGIGGALSNVAIRSVEIHKVDPATLARVVGVSRLSSHGAICLSAPLGGFMVTVGDVTGGSLLLCVLMVLAAAGSGWGPVRERLTPSLPADLPEPELSDLLQGLRRRIGVRPDSGSPARADLEGTPKRDSRLMSVHVTGRDVACANRRAG
ncbi:MFS transporter [Actinomadura sp. ATCC 31491]|uniref:MFS transporter n=1 Tax=Actinomadura luzonensis TaxID=2805427 RepID=A0ABT0G4X0_9ACTN|nr:MFS transporter [Actinomadura luzonensis]MCK2219656.1 MFS transporter [Actinomadura luzonensis]